MENEIKTEVFIEKRERSLFGKVILWLFWGWQILWVYNSIMYAFQLKGSIDPSDGWSTVGGVAGIYVGIFITLAFWFFGTVIFGALAFFTRGSKKIIKSESTQ